MTACLRSYLPILNEQVDFIIHKMKVPKDDMTPLKCLVGGLFHITVGIVAMPCKNIYEAWGRPVNGNEGSHPNGFYKFADITLNLLLGPLVMVISAIRCLAAAILLSPSIALKAED
jgi:hypothetical protein